MAKRLPLSFLLKKIFPKLIFNGDKYTIYLTFDDGPHPETTEWIVNLLSAHQMKATFFFQGNQAQTYPELLRQTKTAGFQVAHHGWEHLNGWKTNHQAYIDNCQKSADFIGSNIFRPPYGKILPLQYADLSEKQRIIMWSLMSRDYDETIADEDLLRSLKDKTKGGDIIVFHENEKSKQKLKNILPEYLEFIQSKKWKTASIQDLIFSNQG